MRGRFSARALGAFGDLAAFGLGWGLGFAAGADAFAFGAATGLGAGATASSTALPSPSLSSTSGNSGRNFRHASPTDIQGTVGSCSDCRKWFATVSPRSARLGTCCVGE